MRPAVNRRRHPVRAALIGLLACGVVLGLSAAGAALYVQHLVESRVDRLDDVFAGLENRPPRITEGPAADALNILLLGTDRRSEVATTGEAAAAKAWVPGAQRADTMMMVHIDGDRDGASVVSIPRDAWVDIPGWGRAKANAAYSYGGASLAVETVEALTGVRVDHVAVIDWDGVRELADAAGGVTVSIPEDTYDSARDVRWTAGEHRLDGEAALDYVGQRYGLPEGDLDRVKRQQAFLRALSQSLMEAHVMSDPFKILDLVDSVRGHVSVDDEWSVREMGELALSLRSVRAEDVAYLTVPVTGFGTVDGQSIVSLDAPAGRRLWAALREDRLAGWLRQHPTSVTPAVVR